jgi:hypothetical protein
MGRRPRIFLPPIARLLQIVGITGPSEMLKTEATGLLWVKVLPIKPLSPTRRLGSPISSERIGDSGAN